MTTRLHHGETARTGGHPRTILALVWVLGLLGFGSIQGGVAMIVDRFEPLGMSSSYLEGTPVDDYLLPGFFLVGLAMASFLTAAGLIWRWPWNWAAEIESGVGYRWPWIGAVATGTVLLAFEIVELFVVPFHPVMHPLLIAIALAIIALALTPSARAHLRAGAAVLAPRR
jgi:hypothetical protein